MTIEKENKMTTLAKNIIGALIVFAISQQILIYKYDRINDQLQTAIDQCVGIKKVR